MIGMNDTTRKLLVTAIEQAGPYTPGQRGELLLVGNVQGGHGWGSGYREINVTLSPESMESLLKEPSFEPIFRAYGINPDMIFEVDAEEITLQYEGQK